MEMQHKKRNFKMRPGMVVSGARGLSPGLPGLAIGLRVDEFLVSIAPQQKWPLSATTSHRRSDLNYLIAEWSLAHAVASPSPNRFNRSARAWSAGMGGHERKLS
jgi:hypothetical protein